MSNVALVRRQFPVVRRTDEQDRALITFDLRDPAPGEEIIDVWCCATCGLPLYRCVCSVALPPEQPPMLLRPQHVVAAKLRRVHALTEDFLKKYPDTPLPERYRYSQWVLEWALGLREDFLFWEER